MGIEEEIESIEKAYKLQISNYSDKNSTDIELALTRICQKLSGKTGLEIEKLVDSSVISNNSESITWERIYRKIGKSKYLGKKFDCARKAEYLANKIGLDKPVLKIDTFLGGKEKYLELETGAIQHISNHFNEKGYEFVASGRNRNKEKDINSLFHLHIPKCGGTSIRNPITHLLTYMHRVTRENNYKTNLRHILHPIMPRNKYEQEALQKYIDELPYKINGAFVSAHGNPWTELREMIESRYNLQNIVLTTLRDPKERLLSTIKHEGHNAKCAKDVYKKIKEYPSSFDNTIYRYLNDYDLETDDKNCSRSESKMMKCIDSIIALDTNSRGEVNKIKSIFLSSNKLPNILQAKRFKDSRDRSKENESKLCEEEINKIFEECKGKSYLLKDEKMKVEELSKNSRKKVTDLVKNELNGLHPLTFIINKNNQYNLVTTKDLLAQLSTYTDKNKVKRR